MRERGKGILREVWSGFHVRIHLSLFSDATIDHQCALTFASALSLRGSRQGRELRGKPL